MLWFTALISMGEALEIPHEQFQLDNGLNVILVEDHKLPQVVVNTWYGVGSFDDPTGASGFAHLFEHLMFMGTTQIPDNEFDVRMEVAGGWNNASTADDRTNYYDVGGSNILDLLLFMEADRMVSLDITQKKLATHGTKVNWTGQSKAKNCHAHRLSLRPIPHLSSNFQVYILRYNLNRVSSNK